MRSVLVALALLAASSITAAATGATAEQCPPRLTVEDAKGDTRLTPTDQPYDAPKMDILRYEIEQTNETLDLHLTLAEKPGGEQNEYYRYWLYFSFKREEKPTERMGIRIAFTSTYDEGDLVGPNSLGNPRLGTFLTKWNGTTMSFHIPLKVLYDALGVSTAFGAPSASADGIHRLPVMQGIGPPRVQDDTFSEDEFKEDFPALLPCLPPIVAEQAQAPPPEAKTPSPSWAAVVLVLVIAGLLRTRRSD
jgi:hypothetical protein